MKAADFNYIAFYDLDHTILEDNSATHLVHIARERGIMKEKHFRHAVWLSILYKLGIGNPTAMIERMLSWINGLDAEEVNILCQEIFDEKIVRRIRPIILETIDMHRKSGGAIVLLSSASEPICRPVAEHLELDDVICSRLEIIDGKLSGKTLGKLVYDKEKKVQMLAYCNNTGHRPEEAYYYGDSYTDQHVMSAVGHPVAVDPDRRLLNIARKRQWEILLRERT